MENTIDESFARIWNMAVEDTDVEKNKPADIVAKLKEKKIIANDRMGILFVYTHQLTQETRIIFLVEIPGKAFRLAFEYRWL